MGDKKIAIIGAGLSGLTAAIELEKAGYVPTIIEADSEIGGRVQTDYVDSFLLDRGFQVLLTSYPETQHYLDYDKLDLKAFKPGAVIYDGKRKFRITDPLREPAKLFTMLFSPVGNLSDKLKIFFWQRTLKKTSVQEIFEKQEISSLQFLKEYGFSEKIINQFFKPFFGGIFLENELKTSSRMLEFVFKMFAEGYASIPAKGMSQIPKQLKDQLQKTEIRLNTSVSQAGLRKLIFSDKSEESFAAIIIATDPSSLMPQLEGQIKPFESVTNLYFSVDSSYANDAIIALFSEQDTLINNIVLLDKVSQNYSEADTHLLSVSVTNNPSLSLEALKKKVISELTNTIPEFKTATIEFIKAYEIKKALPKLTDFKYSIEPSETKVAEGIYLAGDYLLNGSINAAMLSGRQAALGVVKELEGGVF